MIAGMASYLYEGAIALRRMAYQRELVRPIELPAPVIGVGNISVGGTGKSPLTMLLADILLNAQKKPLVITRGHGRKSSAPIIVGANENLPTVEDIGDEPFMMKTRESRIALLVHRHRAKYALENWSKLNSNVVLADDSFQYWKLARDLDILMVDVSQNLFQDSLPKGRFRERVEAYLRADAVVFTRCNEIEPSELEKKIAEFQKFFSNQKPGAQNVPWKRNVRRENTNGSLPPLFFTKYVASGIFQNETLSSDLTTVNGKDAVLVCGIAGKKSFRRMVESLNVKVLDFLSFDDHHWLNEADLQRINASMQEHKQALLLLICSEKDFARWKSQLGAQNTSLTYVKVDLDFYNPLQNSNLAGTRADFEQLIVKVCE